MRSVHTDYKMKSIQLLTAVMLTMVSAGFTQCSRGNVPVINLSKPDTLTFSHSMKGWELYSWPVGYDWKYSILMGTNRIKTYDEVVTNRIAVTGKDSLKILLDKIPAKEYIFWAGEGWLKSIWQGDCKNLSLPDSPTIAYIKNYCKLKDLELVISP